MKLKVAIEKVYVVQVYSDDVGILKTGHCNGTKKDAEEWGKYLIKETEKEIESGEIVIETLTAHPSRVA